MHSLEPQLAGKITGMLLEMSEGEVLHMLEDQTACRSKVGGPSTPCACLWAKEASLAAHQFNEERQMSQHCLESEIVLLQLTHGTAQAGHL